MNIRNLHGIVLLFLSFSSYIFSSQDWETYFPNHVLMMQLQDETSKNERLIFFPLDTLRESFLHPISKMRFEHQSISVDLADTYRADEENPIECTLRSVELVNESNNDQRMFMFVVDLKEFNKKFCFLLQPDLQVVSAKIVVSTYDALEEQFKNNDDALFDQLDEQGLFDNHPGPRKISWFEGLKMRFGDSFLYHVNNICSYISKKCHTWFL